jgi:hypothetical protein
MRDQVSHPYKRTCKIMVLYILIFNRSTFLFYDSVCLKRPPEILN